MQPDFSVGLILLCLNLLLQAVAGPRCVGGRGIQGGKEPGGACSILFDLEGDRKEKRVVVGRQLLVEQAAREQS